MATPVVFKIGTKAQYDSLLVKNPNALYFLTDTKEIYRGADGLAQNSYREATRTTETNNKEVIKNYYNETIYYPVRGDIFNVKTIISNIEYATSYIYDGEDWQEIGASNYFNGISINGSQLIPDQSTKIINLPNFNGLNSGLVPVVPSGIVNKTNYFLNATGEWSIPIMSQIGDLGSHSTVVDYVENKFNEAFSWSFIEEE